MRRRKPRRWPMVLGVLICTFGLLLLLSALVETPADETAVPEEPHTVTGVMFLPATLPSPETAPTAREAADTFWAFALLLGMAVALPRKVGGIDANGRILRRKRYVHSFHLVFRQELACG